MTTPSHPPCEDGARFAGNGVDMDAYGAARLREQFAAWLRAHTRLDAVRFGDILLAVNEALANAKEFACVRHAGTGAIDVEAVRNRTAETLTVTIADQGRWREPDPATQGRIRGRGIPLMRALADDVTIEGSALGTTVCLRFVNVPAKQVADVNV